MAVSISVSDTFVTKDGKAASAARDELDFLEECVALIQRRSGSFTGLSATLTGDHNACTVNAKGFATWTTRNH